MSDDFCKSKADFENVGRLFTKSDRNVRFCLPFCKVGRKLKKSGWKFRFSVLLLPELPDIFKSRPTFEKSA